MAVEGFVSVGIDADIKEGKLFGADVDEERVVLARIDGKLFAIGAICTHRQCDLSEGELVEDVVVCPCHGSNFNMKTGAVVEPPATDPEPVFEVKVEGGRVWVSRSPQAS